MISYWVTSYPEIGYPCNLDSFYAINGLDKNDGLIAEKEYMLPIRIYQYNGTSIRSTIGKDDWDLAKQIAAYNRTLRDRSLKTTYYLDDKILAVPFHLLNCSEVQVALASAKPTAAAPPQTLIHPNDLG